MTNEKHKHPTEGIQQYPGREETIMKNNPFTRFLSVALTAAMLVGVMPGAVLADAGEAIVGASSAVVESIPESTTPEDAAPVATEVPPVTEPEATPETVVEPEASPEVEATPEATEEPEATPEATEQPEATPETTQEPEATPEATEQPEATPEATEEPEVVEGVYNGMAADELFNAFLACQSVADVDALLADLTDEDLNAFAAEIGEESMNALEAHFQALLDAEEPEEEPAEEELPEDEYVEHVPEIVEAPQPVVPFTNAVPMFSSTLTSVVNSRRSMMRSALLATPNSDDSDDNGLQMRKWVEETAEGQYTVNLEVWTEGTVTSSSTTKPLDIVLVLDQSGSMAKNFTSVVYTEYTNQTVQNVYNSYRNNTYVQLDDSSYSKVTINYTPVAGETSYEPVGNATNSELNQQQDKLYYYENGQYYQVSVEWSLGWFTINYTYSANGETWTASGRDNQPGFEAAKNFFYASTEYIDQYAFTYTDKSGQNQTVYMDPYDNAQQSFGQQTSGRKLYYTQNGGAVPRLDALATAVDGFIASVAEKAKGPDGIAGTADDVHHRIAIAGFSSSDYRNTELLTGVTVNRGNSQNSGSSQYYPNGYEYNGPQYYSDDVDDYWWGTYAITPQDYKNSLQNVATSSGLANVQAAVDHLTAHGGTQTDAGMDMANKIFENNSFTEQDIEDERDRVVIVFTDGIPTGKGSSYNSNVAEKAIGYANTAKTTHGADVYAIGIFEGADATSAGDKHGNETQKGNYFMQNLSSNNGTPQSPSYYLSASNSSELNAVFEAISETTGSSRLDLDKDTVVKDVLTQYFTVPNGADTPVDIYTQTYDGTEFTETREEAEGVTATVDPETGEISVTGFDFSTHFISENGRDENNPNEAGDYHGEKLIISFPIIPKEEFWGGNKVPTNNTDASGVFDDNTLVENFPVPDPVDVPLKEISLTAQDRNIYYGNTAPTAEQLVNTIDQPDDWRTDYVNRIEYQVQQDTIKNTEDGEYSVTAVLSSKEEGKYGPDIADPVTANVYVYTPVITWQDTTQQAGTSVDSQFAANKAGDVIWKHGDTLSTEVVMEGTAPTLTYTFAPAEGEEIPKTFTEELHIKVTAVRNEEVEIPLTKVQFDWAENEDSVGCLTSCEDPNPAFQFRIHIPTTTLTLTKEFVDLTTEDVYYLLFDQKGGADKEDQFSFDVNYCYKDGPVSSTNNETEWARIQAFAKKPDGTELTTGSGGDFKVYPTDLLNHEGLTAANLTDEELTQTSNPALGASLAKNASGNWVYTQVLTVPICAEGCYYTVFEQHAELPGYAKQGAASTNWTVTFTDGQDSLSGKGKAVSTNSETIDDGPVDEDELFKNDTFHKLNVKQPVTVSFTNRYTGNMTITKLVSGLDKEDSALVANKEYTIEISPADPEKLKDSGKSGPAFDGKTFTLRRSDGTTETVTFRDGKATVKLKAGETITLEKMPAIQYKVVEVITNTNGEMNLDGYNFVNATYAEVYTDLISGDVDHWNRYETGDTTGRTNTDDQIVAVDVNQTTTPVSKVTVTNTYEVADGVLIINKIVSQFANNGKPVFDFKVTSQEEDGTVYYFHIDMTKADEGVPVLVEEVTLPAGQYKVEELGNLNYPLQRVDGEIKDGIVAVGGTPKTVTFTNKGKNTNIPTDGSGVENKVSSVGGTVIIWQDPKEMGNDQGGNITGPGTTD